MIHPRKRLLYFGTLSSEARDSLDRMDFTDKGLFGTNIGQYEGENYDPKLFYEDSSPSEREKNVRKILAKYQMGFPVSRQESDYFDLFYEEAYIKAPAENKQNFPLYFNKAYGTGSDKSLEYYSEFSAKKAYKDYYSQPKENQIFEPEDFNLSSGQLFEKIRSRPEDYGIVRPPERKDKNYEKRLSELKAFNENIGELVEKRNLILAGRNTEETPTLLKPLLLGSLFVANSLLEAVKGFAGLGGKAVDLFDDAKKFAEGDDLKKDIVYNYGLDEKQEKFFSDYIEGNVKLTQDPEEAAKKTTRKGGELGWMDFLEKMARPGPIIGKFDSEDVPIPVVLEKDVDPRLLAAIYEYTFRKAKYFTAGEQAMMRVESWQDAINRAALPEIDLERLKKSARIQAIEKNESMGFLAKQAALLKENLISEDLFLKDLPILGGAALQAISVSRATKLVPKRISSAKVFESKGIPIPKTSLRVGKGSLTVAEALGVAAATSYEADLETLLFKEENVSKISHLYGRDYLMQAAGAVKLGNYLLALGTSPWLRFERSMAAARAHALNAAALETTKKFKVPEAMELPSSKRGFLMKEGKKLLWEAFTEGLEEGYQESLAVIGESLFEQKQQYGGEWTLNAIMSNLWENKDRITAAGVYGSVLGSIGTLPGFYPLYKTYTSDVYKPAEQTSFYKKYSDKKYLDAYIEKAKQRQAQEFKRLEKEEGNLSKKLEDQSLPYPEKAEIQKRISQIQAKKVAAQTPLSEADLKDKYFKELKERTENVKRTGIDFTEEELMNRAEQNFDMKIQATAAMAAIIRGMDPASLLNLTSTRSVTEALEELEVEESSYDKSELKRKGLFEQRFERFKRLALGEEILGFAFNNAETMFAMNNLSRLLKSSQDEQYKAYLLDNMENELLAESYSYMLRRSAANPETLDFLKKKLKDAVLTFSKDEANKERGAQIMDMFHKIDRSINNELEETNFKNLKKKIDKLAKKKSIRLPSKVKDLLAYEIALQRGAIAGSLQRYKDGYKKFVEDFEKSGEFVDVMGKQGSLGEEAFELLKTKRLRFLEEIKRLAAAYDNLLKDIRSDRVLEKAIETVSKNASVKHTALRVPAYMVSLKETLNVTLAKYNAALKATETVMERFHVFSVMKEEDFSGDFVSERLGKNLAETLKQVEKIFDMAHEGSYHEFLPEDEKSEFLETKRKGYDALRYLSNEKNWSKTDFATFKANVEEVYNHLWQIRKVLLDEYLVAASELSRAVEAEMAAKDLAEEIAQEVGLEEPSSILKNPHLDPASSSKIESSLNNIEQEKTEEAAAAPVEPAKPKEPKESKKQEAFESFKEYLERSLKTMRNPYNLDMFFPSDEDKAKDTENNERVFFSLKTLKSLFGTLSSSVMSREAESELKTKIEENLSTLKNTSVKSLKSDNASNAIVEGLKKDIEEKIVPFLKNFLGKSEKEDDKKEGQEEAVTVADAIKYFFGGLAQKFLPDPSRFVFVEGPSQPRRIYNFNGNFVDIEPGASVDILPREDDDASPEQTRDTYYPNDIRYVTLIPYGLVDQQGNEFANVLLEGMEAVKRYTVFSDVSDWSRIVRETLLEEYLKFQKEIFYGDKPYTMHDDFVLVFSPPTRPDTFEELEDWIRSNEKEFFPFLVKLFNSQIGHPEPASIDGTVWVHRVTEAVRGKLPTLMPKVAIKSTEKSHEYLVSGWNDVALTEGKIKVVASSTANSRARVLNFVLHTLLTEELEANAKVPAEQRQGVKKGKKVSGMGFGWLFQKRLTSSDDKEVYKEYSRIVDDLFPIKESDKKGKSALELKAMEDQRTAEAVKALIAAVDSGLAAFGSRSFEGSVRHDGFPKLAGWKSENPVVVTFLDLKGSFQGLMLPRFNPTDANFTQGAFFPLINPVLSEQAKRTVFIQSWTWLIGEIFGLNASKKASESIMEGMFGKEALELAAPDFKNRYSFHSHVPYFYLPKHSNYNESRIPYMDVVHSDSDQDPAIGYVRMNENEVLLFRKSVIDKVRPVKGNADRRMEAFGGADARTAYVLSILKSPKKEEKEDFKKIGDLTEAFRSPTLADMERIKTLPYVPENLRHYASEVIAAMRNRPEIKTQADFEWSEYSRIPVFMTQSEVFLNDGGQFDFSKYIGENGKLKKGTTITVKYKNKDIEYTLKNDWEEHRIASAAYAVLADSEANWKLGYDEENKAFSISPTARYRFFVEPEQESLDDLRRKARDLHMTKKKAPAPKKTSKPELKEHYGRRRFVVDFPLEATGDEDYRKTLMNYLFNLDIWEKTADYEEAFSEAYRRAAEGEEIDLPKIEFEFVFNYPYEPLKNNLMALYREPPDKYLGPVINWFADRYRKWHKGVADQMISLLYDEYEGTDFKGNPAPNYKAKDKLDVPLTKVITMSYEYFRQRALGIVPQPKFIDPYGAKMRVEMGITFKDIIVPLLADMHSDYVELTIPKKHMHYQEFWRYIMRIKRFLC